MNGVAARCVAFPPRPLGVIDESCTRILFIHSEGLCF